MHVRFTEPYDYTPTLMPRMTIAYRQGWSGSVKAECGKGAITAKKAVRIPTPTRSPKASANVEA